MAKFKIKQIKKMEPRAGQKFSTEYYQQSQRDYDDTFKFMLRIMTEVLEAAEHNNSTGDLTVPLRGFPRTGGRPNYTTEDILCDLIEQYKLGRDWPSGMVGRWNRLFEDFPDYQLEFVEHIDANNFNTLFTNQ
jgi:hypothetical protein